MCGHRLIVRGQVAMSSWPSVCLLRSPLTCGQHRGSLVSLVKCWWFLTWGEGHRLAWALFSLLWGQHGCFHLLNDAAGQVFQRAVVERANNREGNVCQFERHIPPPSPTPTPHTPLQPLCYLGAILACPPVNICGKKEEIQRSVTTVKSSEMEVKWRIRLGSGQRSAQWLREREMEEEQFPAKCTE